MEPKDFCYWLQGYLEISGAETLDATAVKAIKDHIATVFNKVTPTLPTSGQGILQGQGDQAIQTWPYTITSSGGAIC